MIRRYDGRVDQEAVADGEVLLVGFGRVEQVDEEEHAGLA